MSVHSSNITGAVFMENYRIAGGVRLPHEIEHHIVEEIVACSPESEETVRVLIVSAFEAARTIFSDSARTWNQVQQRADAKTAVTGAVRNGSLPEAPVAVATA